eukprot:6461642-Amphidinium_carterae.3
MHTVTRQLPADCKACVSSFSSRQIVVDLMRFHMSRPMTMMQPTSVSSIPVMFRFLLSTLVKLGYLL